MSTLSVTSVTSGNATTDFTLSTGNTSAGDVVIFSNGYGILLSGNSTANTFYLVSNGNIGIGTASPTAKLHIVGPAANDSVAELRIAGSTGYIDFHNSLSSLNYNGIVSTGDKAIIFSEGTSNTGSFVIAPHFTGTSGIKITNNGSVGIGTASPDATFAVSGTANISGNVVITSNNLTLGTSTKAANGYTFLPNGMKMNWGVMVCNTTSTATWSSAFGTNAVSVSVTPISTTHVAANVPYVSAVTSTTGTIRSASTTSTATVYFTAIGY